MLKLAWQAGDRAGDPAALNAHLVHTANRMAMGGIYDHLGGGFARYSVDDRWLAPHFEKMLYDNAQFIDLYSQMWRATKDPLFADRVGETIAWVDREMRHAGGGFYAALDADSEGIEGKFYVWSKAEIDNALGGGADHFMLAYDVSEGGNFEGQNILNRLQSNIAGDSDQYDEAALSLSRSKLLELRDARIRPRRDDKILTDWNGLMISGLVEAATAFGRADWLKLASDAFAFVTDNLVNKSGLFHSWQDERARFDGMLEDYAHMIHAAILLYEATGEPGYYTAAIEWAAYVDNNFSADGGGYYQSSSLTRDVISRTRTCHDQPSPSGNGQMAENLVRLFYLTGDTKFRDSAEAIMTFFAHEARSHPAGHATLVAAADLLANGTQIIITVPEKNLHDHEYAVLRRTVFASPTRRRIFMPLSKGGVALPTNHPAHGKGAIDGAPAAYICHGQTCSLPMTDAETLAEELSR